MNWLVRFRTVWIVGCGQRGFLQGLKRPVRDEPTVRGTPGRLTVAPDLTRGGEAHGMRALAAVVSVPIFKRSRRRSGFGIAISLGSVGFAGEARFRCDDGTIM